jgi:hypothetical protein
MKEKVFYYLRFFKNILTYTPILIFITGVFSLSVIFAATIDESPVTVPPRIISDWEEQDKAVTAGYRKAVATVAASLSGLFAQEIAAQQDSISSIEATDARWRQLYVKACHYRRITRMKPYTDQVRTIVFTRHYTMGGLFQGFQEGIGANRCENYAGGAALCCLTLKNYYSSDTTLLEERSGVIKDPDVSYDGKRILFAWTKDNKGFHLYEMATESPGTVIQLTSNPSGLQVSDFDPCYLPDGNILFQSSRCFQLVDCFYNIASNLYMCDGGGRYLRRIGFDQVQTFYPTMMDDGKVLYTRWEYNDRSQVYSMGLFTMYPDGTHQEELYGNQSWWPTSIIHGRNIPGTGKVMAVLSGHHTSYSGELAIIDPNIGRQEASGIQMIAPVRKAAPVRRDNGGVQFNFQHPYPLDERAFLTGWRSNNTAFFSLYFMDIDGNRELLVWDKDKSINSPIPLAARPSPFQIASTVDYRDSVGAFTMQDIYEGTGLKGITRGIVKRLRVVALDYRVDNAIGYTFFRTDEYELSAHTYTPIARSSGSWDVKRILGETPVYSDGSASFLVPARTPVYFQAIDSAGHVVQTMRSWSTLQPRETFSCFGCHEDKISAPPMSGVSQAGAPKPLEPFHGIERQGFSYPKFVQPIWDSHCISCHNQSHAELDLRGTTVWSGSLTGSWLSPWSDRDNAAKKNWTRSYCNLTEVQGKYVSWIITQSYPTGLAPYPPGSSKSSLITRLAKGHNDVVLTKKEKEIVCAWIDLCIPHSGDYTEGMNAADKTVYTASLNKRKQWEKTERENIKAYIGSVESGIIKRNGCSHAHARTAVAAGFEVHISGRQLHISVPDAGRFSMLDPAGREAFNLTVSSPVNPICTVVPARVAPGVYIANFAGAGKQYHQVLAVIGR